MNPQKKDGPSTREREDRSVSGNFDDGFFHKSDADTVDFG
jgi:hypothetical protein